MPLTLALLLADADDEDDADATGVDEVGADVDDEDELLQAAAVRPRHAMPATTAIRRAERMEMSRRRVRRRA